VRVERANVTPSTAVYDWTVGDPQARLAAPVVSSAPLHPVTDALAVIGILVALGVVGTAAVRRRRRAGTARLAPLESAEPPSAESMASEARNDERDSVRS
jgi:hypothetical protein